MRVSEIELKVEKILSIGIRITLYNDNSVA